MPAPSRMRPQARSPRRRGWKSDARMRQRERHAMTTLGDEIALAAGHFAAGRFDEAAAAYRRALALSPRNAALQHNLGVALAADGRSDEAAVLLRQAAAMDPTSPPPWLSLRALRLPRH